MVFAANGATVVDGRVLQARFANPQRARRGGGPHRLALRNGILYGGGETFSGPMAVNEAEGDFAILARPHPGRATGSAPAPRRTRELGRP